MFGSFLVGFSCPFLVNWVNIGKYKFITIFFSANGSVGGGPPLAESYVAALYFTMTSLTSVGFGNVAGNTESEQIFCVIMLIFGGELFLFFNNMQ